MRSTEQNTPLLYKRKSPQQLPNISTHQLENSPARKFINSKTHQLENSPTYKLTTQDLTNLKNHQLKNLNCYFYFTNKCLFATPF